MKCELFFRIDIGIHNTKVIKSRNSFLLIKSDMLVGKLTIRYPRFDANEGGKF
jgi:hypothetical protein